MSYALIRHLRRCTTFSQLVRMEATMTNLTHEDLVFKPSTAHWSKVIREAEKIVGYPTSFMNLRWLLSDEFANMAMYLRKVVGSNHPIIQTAKSVLYNEQNNTQPWGLIILLLSNAVRNLKSLDTTNQRILAELTEMIRTGHHVHRGLLNTTLEERKENIDTVVFGNKIAILIGDYLLVTANGMLARLKNQDLSYLISTALRDISEGQFYGPRDSQNMPLPGQSSNTIDEDEFFITVDTTPLEVLNTLGNPIREWTLRTMYSGGSLLGRGCQGTMVLANRSAEDQESAYLFGCNLCLAWQAATDLQVFNTNKPTFSLTCAPVLFALNSAPHLYEVLDKIKDDVRNLDYKSFREEILKTDALDKTKLLYEKHASKAKEIVDTFGDSQSISTIKRLI